MSNAINAEFPLYLIKVDGKKKFVSMKDAGDIYISNWGKVEVDGLVLEADLSVRSISDGEVWQIIRNADAVSAGT